MTTTDKKLCRFLIVNEDDIRKSDLFTDCLGLSSPVFLKLYEKIKSEHAGNLFFLNYALDVLKQEREVLPEQIKKIEKEYDLLGNEHVQLIVKIGKRNHVSDEFLKMAIKMYATYEMEVCSQVEFSILEGLFNSIEKSRPSLNDDLKVLLESYKKVYEREIALKEKIELNNSIDEYIDNVEVLHGAYIRTFGFDDEYVKKEHRDAIKELNILMKNMFNIISLSDNGISAQAIVAELSKYTSHFIEGFAMLDSLNNYRPYGDGVYLDDFIEYIEKKEIRDEKNEDEENEYDIVKKAESRLLIRYKSIINRMRAYGVSLGAELDFDIELKQIRKIIKDFYIDKKVKRMVRDKEEKEGGQKYKEEFVNIKVLKKLDSEETEEYFKELEKLQVKKIKKITDTIVVLEKQEKIISKYKLKKNNISYTQMTKLFEKLDWQISSIYNDSVKEQLDMLKSYKRTNYMRKRKGMEPLERLEILYRRLFSAEPNGVDLDEHIERKNRFYVCNFNPEIGIMTFPYANISSGEQSSKFSRAAIVYDISIQNKIVCENRGASWASDPDERVKKEMDGKTVKIYTGNKMVINNRSHTMLQVVSNALFVSKEEKEELSNGRVAYLSSHKFDYRKGKVRLNEWEKVKEHERGGYHGISNIAWISNDDIDISDYKAVCYMDSAEELKNFIESL